MLPSRWFWGPAAELHRERARSPDHYPSHVDRELMATHAAMLLGLVDPDTVVDLAPAANRHVRQFAIGLADARRRGRCVLHDRVGARLIAAVQRLSSDFPTLDVSGVLATDEPPTVARGGVRLVLTSAGGPDGPDVEGLVQHLRVVAQSLGPEDAAVVSLELGADRDALLRACRDAEGRAEALHRAAFVDCVTSLGGLVDASAFAFEARWDAVRRCVETRLHPDRTVRIALPDGEELRLERPIRTAQVATWTRMAFRRAAARARLVLAAWLPDPEERRALALVRAPGPCAGASHLL